MFINSCCIFFTDLLNMNDDESNALMSDFGCRQRGCDNLSVYNEIALQGGHKGKIEYNIFIFSPSLTAK